MERVPVAIVKFLSSDQPGFVAVSLVDAYGVTHRFQDKVPVFTDADIDADTELPADGWLGCNIVERFDADGRSLARIDTEKPWGIESTDGAYLFVVAADAVISDSDP